MNNKKIIGIVVAIIAVVILLKILIGNHSSFKSSDVNIKVKSVNQISATGMDVFGEKEDYVKVKISITNNSNETVFYKGNQLITKAGKTVSSEFLSVDEDDNLAIYTSIKPSETIESFVYFKTSYEDGIQLKTEILYNVSSDGSNINGDVEEYFCDLKK